MSQEILDASSLIPGVVGQGPLQNQQHEAFCILISSGMSMKESFTQVFGYVPMPSDVNELLSVPAIQQRIHSISQQYNNAAHLTVVGHLEMLAQIRDAALQIQEVGVAYQCERARGEAVGLYGATKGGRSKGAKISLSFSQPTLPKSAVKALQAPAQAAPKMPDFTLAFA